MGPHMLCGAVVAIAKVALAATVITRASLASSVTVKPDPPYVKCLASDPIRTTVTLNSNENHVIAVEEDVPKTLGPLQELCSSPLGSLWPEICDQAEKGSIVGDSEADDPESQLTATMGVSVISSEVPSTSTYGPPGAAETGSATHGNMNLSDHPEYIPEASKVVSTLAAPGDCTLTTTSTTTVTAIITLPTIFETRIKSILSGFEEESRNTDSLPSSDLVLDAILESPAQSSAAIIGAPPDSGIRQSPTIDGRDTDRSVIAISGITKEPTAVTDEPDETGLPLGYPRQTGERSEVSEPSVTSATMIICYTSTPATDSHKVFEFTLSSRPSESRTSFVDTWPHPPNTGDDPSTTTADSQPRRV